MLAAAAATALVLIAVAPAADPQPKPTLVFGTTMRITQAFAHSPGAGAAGDGCLAAEEMLLSGGSAVAVSKVVFDAEKGRIRQSNAQLQRGTPTQNVTNIGRWEQVQTQYLHLLCCFQICSHRLRVLPDSPRRKSGT
jgi:hypothetical protein